MFNVLPEYLRKRVRVEYNLHLFIIGLVIFVAIQLSFLVFLFPSWFLSSNKEDEVSLLAQGMDSSSLDSKINLTNSTIESINTRLEIINSVLDYPKVLPLVDTILSKKTKNIYIRELIYTSTSGTTGKINLAGIAATRESLVQFVKSLEETKKFQKVDLPVSNFTKDRDINFSISMSITI